MKLGFLTLAQDDRRLYFEQVALTRNISPYFLSGLSGDLFTCR